MALTEIFYDTFTDTAGTLIADHTPDVGVGWVGVIGNAATPATQVAADGTLVQPFHSGTMRNYFSISASQSATALQAVEGVFKSATVRLCLRLGDGSSSANCVLVEFSSSLNRVDVFIVEEGARTLLISRGADGLIAADAVCRAEIDASNNLKAWVAGSPIEWVLGSGEYNYNVAAAPASGAVGWCGVKSYTTGGNDNFKAFYDVGGGGPATVTSTIAAGLPTPSAASTVNVQSTTVSFTVAAGLPVPSASSAVTIVPAAGDPIFTSDPLHDNTDTLLANAPLDYVAIYDNTTGALVLRVTGISTNASGQFSVQSALLTSGVTYKVDWKVTSQLIGRMPAKAAV